MFNDSGKMGFRFLILNPVVTKTGALVMPMPSKCFDSGKMGF